MTHHLKMAKKKSESKEKASSEPVRLTDQKDEEEQVALEKEAEVAEKPEEKPEEE